MQKKEIPTDGKFLSGFWRTDRLIPVITLVIYFGSEDWDAPLSLKKMYSSTNDVILAHAPDYHVNLIAPKEMSDGEIDEFHSNLREVMLYIKYSKDRSMLDKIIDENDANNDDQFNLTSDVEEKRKVNPLQELVRQFEIEFGRLLSPIEKQEIAAWLNIDHYNPEIVKLALREAILAQVYNFKYVDRILLNWQRHGLNTPDQIKNFLQRN